LILAVPIVKPSAAARPDDNKNSDQLLTSVTVGSTYASAVYICMVFRLCATRVQIFLDGVPFYDQRIEKNINKNSLI